MIHNDAQIGAPGVLYLGTKAAIEASFATEGQIAHATDTHLMGFYDGSAWIWGTTVTETDPIFLARATDTGHYTGFPNRTDTTLAFVAGALGATRTLTLGGTNFKICINGTEYNIATDMTKQITDTTGIWWFWIELVVGVPTLQAQISTSPGFDKCLVATVYWNTTIDLGLMADERHWMGRDQWMHEYLHETIGTRYALGLAGTFAADGTFSIDTGEVYDEDIEHEITPAQTACNRMYKNGSANWKWDVNDTVLPKIISNIPQYNNGNALADVGINDYFAMWVFVSNHSPYPIMVMMGQRTDGTLANSRTNNTPDSLSYGTLPSAEMKLIYRVLYRRKGGSPYFSYIETADYRTVSNLPNTNYVATLHSALSGLQNLDHGAAAIIVDTSAFDGNLSSTDDTVQKALDKIDEITAVAADVPYVDTDPPPAPYNGQLWWDTDDSTTQDILDSDVSFSDNTTGDFSQAAHGYTPKAPVEDDMVLHSDGSWSWYKNKVAMVADLTILADYTILHVGVLDTVTYVLTIEDGGVLNII